MTCSHTNSTFVHRLATALAGGSLAVAALLTPGCGGDRPAPKPTATVAPKAATDEKVKLRTGAEIPFERSWDLKLPRAVQTSWVGEQIPELVFFQLQGTGEIYAVDTMSGNTRFVTMPLPKPLTLAPFVSRVKMRGDKQDVITNDDRLYVVCDDVLYCFDAIYGQLIWRDNLGFSASSGPVAVGPEGNLRVFIGDWGGRMQVTTYHTQKQFPYQLWQWNVYSPLTATPVEKEGLVYAGDHNGYLHCFKMDREKAWSFKAGGTLLGAPTVTGHAVCFGTTENVFYALNRLTGEELGSVFINAPMKRDVFHYAAEPSRVYVWSEATDDAPAGLHAIKTQADNVAFQDTTKHALEVERVGKDWFVAGATDLVSSTPEHLYLIKGDSTIVNAVNRVTGKTDWAWDLNESRKSEGRVAHVTRYQDPTDLNRSIFTVDSDGQVVAYRLFGYKPKDEPVVASAKPAPGQAPATGKPGDPAKPAGDAPPKAPKPKAPAAPRPAPAPKAPAPAPAPKPAADAKKPAPATNQ